MTLERDRDKPRRDRRKPIASPDSRGIRFLRTINFRGRHYRLVKTSNKAIEIRVRRDADSEPGVLQTIRRSDSLQASYGGKIRPMAYALYQNYQDKIWSY